MNIVLLGHILQLIGILFACLATMFAFLVYIILKKGRLARSAQYVMIGRILLAVNVFILYTGAITGTLDKPGLLWAFSGFLTFLGFGFITYAQLEIIKIFKKEQPSR